MGYVAQNGDAWFLIMDGQEAGGAYDAIGYPIFSRDGTHMACEVKREGKWLVVLDGQMGGEFDDVAHDSLVFSADGKRLAYVAVNEGKRHVVADGKIGGAYEGVAVAGALSSVRMGVGWRMRGSGGTSCLRWSTGGRGRNMTSLPRGH